MKYRKNETYFELDTWLEKTKINVTTNEDYYVTINKKDIRHLQTTITYTGPVKAPIQKGEKIAELIIKNKDEVLKKLSLYAAEDLKK